MEKLSSYGDCYIQKRSTKFHPKDSVKLIVFDGWSIYGDSELYVSPENNPTVFFKGDQGTVRIGNVNDVSEIVESGNYDEKFEVKVPYYITEDHDSQYKNKPAIFIRNMGAEEVFSYPYPHYLYDTRQKEVFKVYGHLNNRNYYIDNFIVTDPPENPVYNVRNCRTKLSTLVNAEAIENELGERFHVIKQVVNNFNLSR